MNYAQCQGLISLAYVTHYFEVYSDDVNHFKDQLFLVIPLHEDSHAKIFVIETKPEYRCMIFFL